MSTRDSNNIFRGDEAASTPAASPQPHVPPPPRATEQLFEVPVTQIPLPSRGKVYPDQALRENPVVQLKAMTAKEEDILLSEPLIRSGTVITHLLRSTLVGCPIDPADLLSGDRNALMVSLRILGYGQDYDVELTCPSCREASDVTVNLNDIPVKMLDIDPIEEGVNEFPFTLPSGVEVTFKFLTGRDEEVITRDQEMRKKKLKTQVSQVVTERLKRSILSVNGDRSRGTINRFVDSMLVRDSMALRKHIAACEPGMEMKAAHMCPSCGDVNEVEVPLGASFFWPDA